MKIQKRARICLCVSAAILVIALVMSLLGYGINYGIDFAGGLNIQYDMGAAFNQADVETALRNQGISQFTISSSGAEGHVVQIRVPTLSGDEEIQNLQNGLEAELSQIYPEMDTETATASYVGPVAGATLVRNAVISVLLATVLMLAYIALRFDFASGLAAVIGLLHDVLIMIAFMVILRSVIQMNSSFIAAMLTIVGYSINNTIVVFDRVRENTKLLGKRKDTGRDEIVNKSIKESMTRSINTSITTLLTIGALYVLGVDSIKEFALPIIIGLVAGTYSSVFIATPLWSKLHKKEKKAA